MHQVFANLHQSRAVIGGSWCEAASGRRLEVVDPATGAVIGSVPEMATIDAEHAIEAAAIALPGWRQQPAKARGQLLRRWFEVVTDAAEDLAAIITAAPKSR